MISSCLESTKNKILNLFFLFFFFLFFGCYFFFFFKEKSFFWKQMKMKHFCRFSLSKNWLFTINNFFWDLLACKCAMKFQDILTCSLDWLLLSADYNRIPHLRNTRTSLLVTCSLGFVLNFGTKSRRQEKHFFFYLSFIS